MAGLLAAGLMIPAFAGAPSQADVKRAEAQRALHQSQAEAARARAAALAAMQASLSQQRVQAAARLRAAEEATAAAADRMADLAAQKKKVAAELVARAAAFAPMLPLIERLALYPSETLLAVPAPPQNTLRGLWSCRACRGRSAARRRR